MSGRGRDEDGGRERVRDRDRDRDSRRGRRGNQPASDDEAESNSNESGDEGSADWTEAEGKAPADPSLDDPEALGEKISEVMEALEAKRATTREEGLSELKKLLSTRNLQSHLEGKTETFLDLLKRGIRKGAEAESKSAAENLALFFLLIGPGNEPTFLEFRSLLQDLIRTHSADAAKPAFVGALAIACFVSSTELESTTGVLDFLEEVFSRNYPPIVVASAVNSWGLLATTVPPSRLGDAQARLIKQLKKLLDSEDYEVRVAAGTAIALVVEILRNEEIEILLPEGLWEDLLERLKELANDSNRHKAKKERTKQRSIFRDISKSVERGETPLISLKFKHEVIEFDSWGRIKQLESLREVLGIGLHAHFLFNDFVRQIFELPPAQVASEFHPTKMSSIEKRMLYAPNSKARSKWLDSKRKNKSQRVGTESFD